MEESRRTCCGSDFAIPPLIVSCASSALRDAFRFYRKVFFSSLFFYVKPLAEREIMERVGREINVPEAVVSYFGLLETSGINIRERERERE